MLTNLKEIDQKTIDDIQCKMNPEEATAIHLKFGPLRYQAYYNSMDSGNSTTYFIVNTWKLKPKLQLIRRKGFDMCKLVEFQLPRELAEAYGNLKGIFSPDEETLKWIKANLV